MSANGISRLLAGDGSNATANKEARQIAKLNLAQTRRQAGGDTAQPYYRSLNVYDRVYLPEPYNVDPATHVWSLAGRPWNNTASVVDTPLNLVPDAVTKLRIWYDGSDVTQFQPTNPSDGATITQWNDKSNYAHNANPTGGATKRPTYQTNELNSLSVVQFDGINDCLSVNPIVDIRSIAQWNLFCVVKFTDTTGNRWISQSDNGTNSVALYHNGANMAVANAGGVGVSANALNTTGYHYMSVSYDGTATGNADRLKLRIDGSNEALTFTGTVGATNPANIDHLMIGCNGADSEYFQGYIAEYILYYAQLNPTEINSIESYLVNRWAL